MKEIGGYFEFENLICQPFYLPSQAFNTGRNCLAYILEKRNIHVLWMPYFTCDVLIRTCERCGCRIEFYQISDDFLPPSNLSLNDDSFLYLINYYGQITEEMLIHFQQIYPHIILDNTQAFFSRPKIGIDTIYSCRKYFGVPDGAYLMTDIPVDETLETETALHDMTYLTGRSEYGGKAFYSRFLEHEQVLDDLPIRKMSAFSKNILGAIDYNRVKKRRDTNFQILYKHFKPFNFLRSLRIPEGAFAYPLLLMNGQEIREKLKELGIYIPLLWPNVKNHCFSKGLDYRCENILPLPCDQRYDEADMLYLIDHIMKVL